MRHAAGGPVRRTGALLWPNAAPVHPHSVRRALGFPAPGTYAQYSKLSSIKETRGVPEAKEMIAILVSGQEAVARTARKIFPVVDKSSDEPTADLLTQRMQVHEKTAWMLRSLLEA